MGEWIDITRKAKKKLPVIDREFLDRYIDEYSTRRYVLMMYKRKLNFSKIAPFKEQNIEYILNNSWETILKDQLHKIAYHYQFHRSLESRFFMDVIATMIAAEIVSRVKPYRGEKISIDDGMLHYKLTGLFGVPAWTFFNVKLQIVEESYHTHIFDDEKHPKLYFRMYNDRHGGSYRKDLDDFKKEMISRVDAVCASENIQISLDGGHGVDIVSRNCRWIDHREEPRK
jgi:hypothetical protein